MDKGVDTIRTTNSNSLRAVEMGSLIDPASVVPPTASFHAGAKKSTTTAKSKP